MYKLHYLIFVNDQFRGASLYKTECMDIWVCLNYMILYNVFESSQMNI